MGDGNHFRSSCVFLHDLAVVHVSPESFLDGINIRLAAVLVRTAPNSWHPRADFAAVIEFSEAMHGSPA